MSQKNYIYPGNAVLAAPLSGYTDLPYRRSLRRQGCFFAFTEMVDAASIAYSNNNSAELLRRGEDEEFLAVQLVGSDLEHLRVAVDHINQHEFDVFDFNLGCPVPKVVKKGAGAALGRKIDRALECFEVLTKYSRFPLTAKMRILHYENPEPTLELCRGLVALGAQALTIHGRTMEHFYTGTVNFSIIKAVKNAFPQIPVIANGGVCSKETYDEMRRESGCSRVMLAQGAMGHPWLFRELEGGAPPTLEEWREMVSTHISGMVKLYGEESAMRRARKIVHDYLRGRGFPSSLRNTASALSTEAELAELLAIAVPAAEVANRKIIG